MANDRPRSMFAGCKSEFRTITPDEARELLYSVPCGNRDKLNLRRVDILAADMISGEFKPGSSTIIIGSDGVLLDGRHRMAAVIKSERPMEFCVAHVNADFNSWHSGRDDAHIRPKDRRKK